MECHALILHTDLDKTRKKKSMDKSWAHGSTSNPFLTKLQQPTTSIWILIPEYPHVAFLAIWAETVFCEILGVGNLMESGQILTNLEIFNKLSTLGTLSALILSKLSAQLVSWWPRGPSQRGEGWPCDPGRLPALGWHCWGPWTSSKCSKWQPGNCSEECIQESLIDTN